MRASTVSHRDSTVTLASALCVSSGLWDFDRNPSAGVYNTYRKCSPKCMVSTSMACSSDTLDADAKARRNAVLYARYFISTDDSGSKRSPFSIPKTRDKSQAGTVLAWGGLDIDSDCNRSVKSLSQPTCLPLCSRVEEMSDLYHLMEPIWKFRL
jgi:hypothetical protein